ncbi:MAG: hypothetical protein HQ511_06165 [Rhodospirillales bacterium]|nr:hypothetical protein [Rhodospirillales bacterium]
MAANDNDGNDEDPEGIGKPGPEVLSAALAQGLEHEARQAEETRKILQEKLNEGVRQLRAVAKEHNLVWPEDED